MKTARDSGVTYFIASLTLIASIVSCQKAAIDTPCTAEFRSIGVTVLGDSLTDFYTIRESTSDTIRRSTGVESRTHWYTVLDDSYQSAIGRSQERFKFIGKIDGTIVVNEDYIIKGNGCHIIQISGKTEVQL